MISPTWPKRRWSNAEKTPLDQKLEASGEMTVTFFVVTSVIHDDSEALYQQRDLCPSHSKLIWNSPTSKMTFNHESLSDNISKSFQKIRETPKETSWANASLCLKHYLIMPRSLLSHWCASNKGAEVILNWTAQDMRLSQCHSWNKEAWHSGLPQSLCAS